MQLAQATAVRLAAIAAAAIRTRGSFALALSGGTTPWPMLAVLATLVLDPERIEVFQVDERAVPDGDERRNWTHIRRSFVDRLPIPEANLHPMPVLAAPEPAAREYAAALARVAGTPPVLDCALLGLGDDGHTASLVPNDPVLDVDDRDVAWTAAPYQDTQRMTLTFPCLARARHLVWLVAGDGKAEMVARAQRGDRSIPAGRLPTAQAEWFLDAAATPA